MSRDGDSAAGAGPAPVAMSSSGSSGLQTLVSTSSARIAALRALESERPDCIFSDPLAKLLAGEQYRIVEEDVRQSTPAADPSKPRELNAIALRTKFFDDFNTGAAAAGGLAASFLGAAEQMKAAEQVVLLGAGMDTRPWRLEGLEHVAWWEVDQQDVTDWKTAKLKAEGAQVTPCIDKTSDGAYAFPLKVRSWNAVTANLETAGWSRALVEQGLRTDRTTVWVLEGLVYYLQPNSVPELLREMRSVSGPGSWMLMDTFSETSLRKCHANMDAWGNLKNYVLTWKFAPPDDFAKYFKAYGWSLVAEETVVDASNRLGYKMAKAGDTTMHYVILGTN